MTNFLTTTEIVRLAHETLEPVVWDYITGGSETESSILRNREAIEALAFRARILRNVEHIDMTTTLLGTKLRIPYMLAPVGGMTQILPEGAAAQVAGACAFGTLPVVSSVSLPSPEECMAAGAGDKWFQLYVRGDFDWIKAIVDRVRTAGFRALVLTADVAYYSNRERQLLSRWAPESRLTPVGENYQARLDWALVDRIKEIAGIPVVIKGIQAEEDAEIALQHGIDAIWVSNHGGRQIDHALGSIDVLPAVVEVVGRKVPVIVDGGFMRGTDICKALALGADVVATGRMHAWALGAGGQAALERMLELMEFELMTSLGLLGVTAPSQLNPKYLARVAPSRKGAFPHWGEFGI